MPELYRFTLATYSCEPSLILGDQLIPSQQGDPSSPLEFCESIQPVINQWDCDLEIDLTDNLSLSADLQTFARDVTTIIESESSTGFKLTASKCEIITDYFSLMETFEVLKVC